jgi:predicted Rossmann fold nucleotide-binding protein DprA/Smf involved in DNA uptake
MKKIQTQLKTIAKTLAGLAEKIEKLNAMIGAPVAKKKAAPVKKKAAPVKKKAAPAKKKAAPAKKKAAPAKKAVATGKETVLDSVLDVIGKSKDGADIASLKSQTGLESRQLSNALYKLTKKGLIKSKSRGVYVKA